MSVLRLKNKDFDAAIRSGTALVDFYADWCGPCKMVSPLVDEIARERAYVTVAKVNVDESPDLAARFGVVSIPTLMIFKDGKEINRIIGFKPKAAILAELDK